MRYFKNSISVANEMEMKVSIVQNKSSINTDKDKCEQTGNAVNTIQQDIESKHPEHIDKALTYGDIFEALK